LEGKHAAESFPSHDQEHSRKYLVGEKLHMDVCGPIRKEGASSDKVYIAAFIDDESDMSFAYLMDKKNQVTECLSALIPFMERQTGNKLKCMQSDGGKEYVNNTIKNYCQENGIIHQVSIKYTPQQNSRAERLNRTLLEKLRCLLWSTGCPQELFNVIWKEALHTANFLRNVSPTTRNGNKIPHEKFWNFRPDLSRLRVFGCEAFAQVPREERNEKLDKRSIRSVMMGYEPDTKG
jgi:transposase InsO family protein